MTDPTIHQAYIAVPRLDTPITNPDGTIAPAWYRLLIGMFNRLGGAMLAQPNGVFIAQAPVGAGAPLAAYSVVDGSLIGVIQLGNQPGAPAVVEVVGASPWVFTAGTAGGTLVVESGEVEVSRDGGGAWYRVGLLGGAVPVLVDDKVRVSWTGSKPAVTFLPYTVQQ